MVAPVLGTLVEHAKNILEVEALRATLEIELRTRIVIALSLCLIAQHAVGLLYLLESCFVPALVGMMLAGQPAISTLDFFWRR